MTILAEHVKRTIPSACIQERCARDGCELQMDELHRQKAIINMDCRELEIPLDHPRCDYIFAGATATNADGDFLAPIEMKRGKTDADKFCRQLKAGAQFAQSRLALENMDFQFRPIAVYGKGMHRDQINRLKRYKIPFRGDQYEIKLVRCGTSLVKALR